MDPEGIMLSKINRAEQDKYCMISTNTNKNSYRTDWWSRGRGAGNNGNKNLVVVIQNRMTNCKCGFLSITPRKYFDLFEEG